MHDELARRQEEDDDPVTREELDRVLHFLGVSLNMLSEPIVEGLGTE
jgi:hypothetical protein